MSGSCHICNVQSQLVAEVRYQHNLTFEDDPSFIKQLQYLIHQMHNVEIVIQQQSRAKTPQNSLSNDKVDGPTP